MLWLLDNGKVLFLFGVPFCERFHYYGIQAEAYSRFNLLKIKPPFKIFSPYDSFGCVYAAWEMQPQKGNDHYREAEWHKVKNEMKWQPLWLSSQGLKTMCLWIKKKVLQVEMERKVVEDNKNVEKGCKFAWCFINVVKRKKLVTKPRYRKGSTWGDM